MARRKPTQRTRLDDLWQEFSEILRSIAAQQAQQKAVGRLYLARTKKGWRRYRERGT